ncbi:hypothetical protein JW960_25795 [candidate division KSB1 bacterium]|nr:hypothetical protein [candidate division KSB1 bacterium]
MAVTKSPLKIIYGIQGEGRGHASRSLHLIHHLLDQGHSIEIFTGGDALPLLQGESLPLMHVPLLRLYYGCAGNLHILKTAYWNFRRFWGLLTGLSLEYRTIKQKIAAIAPDFIISDFEPFTAFIGKRLGIPVLSIDHQRQITETELPGFNLRHQRFLIFLYKLFIRILCGPSDRSIVSSFYHFPARQKTKSVFVGPFIHKMLYQLKATQGKHITIYLKESQYLRYLLPAITPISNVSFQIFSNWVKNDQSIQFPDNVALFSIDQHVFLHSLASCQALITTAGNQVIGEAIFLGKPILAFPKIADIEQEINARALLQSGFGETFSLQSITSDQILTFISQLSHYRAIIRKNVGIRLMYDGTFHTLKMIDQFIEDFIDVRSQLKFNSWKSKFKLESIGFTRLGFEFNR